MRIGTGKTRKYCTTGTQHGAPPAGELGEYRDVVKPVREFRLVVTAEKDVSTPVTEDMWRKFVPRLSAAVEEQQEDLTQNPIRINEKWFSGGRINIEAADKESMDKLVPLIATKVTANGHGFKAVHVTETPKTATLVLRIEEEGPVDKLITSPTLGIARMNGWKNLGVTPIRILSVETNESQGDSRFVHIAVTRSRLSKPSRKWTASSM